MSETTARETITSTEVIPAGSVEKGDYLKIVVAAGISAAAVIIASGFLVAAIYLNDSELKTWATGLISLVVGAAIGFVFSGSNDRI